jgi:hypothetical protein
LIGKTSKTAGAAGDRNQDGISVHPLRPLLSAVRKTVDMARQQEKPANVTADGSPQNRFRLSAVAAIAVRIFRRKRLPGRRRNPHSESGFSGTSVRV